MTKKMYPVGATQNIDGTGRGLKAVTRPLTKKRGASKDRTSTIADNRAKYVNTALIPADEIADTIDPNKPLTEKAKLFVKFWAQGETIANASARAGYGDGATYAYRLARYPQAIALYNEEKRLYEESCQMTRKKVMEGLLEGIDMAKMMAEPSTVIQGWKTIGQMCGYFEPVKRRVDINLTGNVTVDRLTKLSDAELLRVIEQGVAADLQQLADESDADD